MNQTIEIYNPRVKPYGPLSNNYIYYFQIGNVKVPSVTHYIYSEILCKPSYKLLVLKERDPINARKLAQKLYYKCFDDIAINTIRRATVAKFSNPELMDVLLSTGNAKLEFNDESLLLGTGIGPNQGRGKNIIGVALEKFRSTLQAKERSSNKEEDPTVYLVYLAKEVLMNAIMMGENISEYDGLSYDEIIDSYGEEKIKKEKSSREMIYDNYRKGNIDKIVQLELENPGNLVKILNKEYISKIKKSNIQLISNIIFIEFTNYLLEKNFPNLKESEYEEARAQEFLKLKTSNLKDIYDRLTGLYFRDKLPKPISKKISKKTANLYIPLDSEIEEAEDFDLEEEILAKDLEASMEEEDMYNPVYRKDLEGFDFIEKKKTPVNRETISFSDAVGKYKSLSPYDMDMFTLDGYQFPSIAHAIYTYIMASFPVMNGLNHAHSRLLKNKKKSYNDINNYISVPQVIDLYYKIEQKNLGFIYTETLKTALDAKFSDMRLQNLLLTTGNRYLIYTDKGNSFLGIGENGDGENYVGKYLMDLRYIYSKNRSEDEIMRLSNVVLTMSNDPEIVDWINIKLRDVLTSTDIIKKLDTQYIGNLSSKLKKLNDEDNQLTLKRNDPLLSDEEQATIKKRKAEIYRTKNIIINNIKGYGEAAKDTITGDFMEMILTGLYFPCSEMDIGFVVSKIPPTFQYNIKPMIPYKLEPKALTSLWKYTSLISYWIEEEMRVNNRTFHEQIDYMKDLLKDVTPEYIDIGLDYIEGCIYTAIHHILRVVLGGRPMEEADIKGAVSIILGDKRTQIDSTLLNVSKKTKTKVVEKIMETTRELTEGGKGLAKKLAKQIYIYIQVINDILYNYPETLDRVFFFCEK